MKRHLAFAAMLIFSLGGALGLSIPWVMGDCIGSESELAACAHSKLVENRIYLAAMIVMCVFAIIIYRRRRHHALLGLVALAIGPTIVTMVYASL